MQPLVLEDPILWLGTAGFSAEEKAWLATPMAGPVGGLQWQHAPLAQADAWLIHGARVAPAGNGEIRVGPGSDGEQPLRLNLRDVVRPVAFAEPLPPAFEPLCRFDLASPTSMEAAFRRLEIWLRPMRARFAIGRQMVASGTELRHGIFHLTQPGDGKLLAMLNFRTGKGALAPDLHPALVEQAHWEKRPAGAGKAPPGFTALTTAQLSWTYLRHSAGGHLPEHYRKRPIHYRGMPRVPLHWLTDVQLAVLRELSVAATTLAALKEQVGIDADRLEQDLACLYYASAITTTASKAGRANRGRNDSSWVSGPTSLRQTAGGSDDPVPTQGLTVPAWLTDQDG